MKKYLLGLFAVVLAVGFSAFTVSDKQSTIVYLVYDGSGDQNLISNYAQQSTAPATCDIFSAKLCWLKVTDPDNSGIITQTEFYRTVPSLGGVFTVFDTDNDLTLDDQTENPGILEKKQ